MQASTTPAHAPRDNLLGVCHALGEDFGFDPIYLRIMLAATLLYDFRITIVAYAVGAVAVAAGRLLTRSNSSRAPMAKA